MNRFISRATRIAAVASLSIACAAPAFAQSSTGSSGGTTSGASVETRRDTNNDRDYGWLGLLGLAGLLGLRRKREDHTTTRASTASR